MIVIIGGNETKVSFLSQIYYVFDREECHTWAFWYMNRIITKCSVFIFKNKYNTYGAHF